MINKSTLIAVGLVLLVGAALLADSKSQPAQTSSRREARLAAWQAGTFNPPDQQQTALLAENESVPTVESLRKGRLHGQPATKPVLDDQAAAQAQKSPAATYTVTNTADSGPGSLRQAILDANTLTPGVHDFIQFNILPFGPVHTIFPLTPLPWLTDPAGVTIDGLTQAAAGQGPNPPQTLSLKIELDGLLCSTAGPPHSIRGIVCQSDYDTVQGLIVNNWWNCGIGIQGGPTNLTAQDCMVRWNIVGMDSTGTICKGNGREQGANLWSGICITNSPPDEFTPAYAFNNTIQENLTSCNYTEGITVLGPIQPGDVYSNIVLGNWAGTDINGTSDRGNVHEGIDLAEGTHDNLVRGNMSSGNDYDGIGLQGYDNELFPPAPPIQTRRNLVDSNIVGLDVNLNPLPNTFAGITVGEYGPSQWGCADSNFIGPDNIIADNGWDGVAVWEDNVNNFNADWNLITQNSIYDNTGLGIDLQNNGVTPNDPADPDTGPNQEMNFPVITGAAYSGGTTTITGTIDTPSPNTVSIEVFKARLDPTGYGEGETYLGMAVPDAAGNWNLVTTVLVVGDSVTATARDMINNTSEFSATVAVTGQQQLDTCEYYKPAYVDYAPVGMPDFDQKQDAWTDPSGLSWTHCGPVALADCYWWFDSKFETGGTPPPAISDNYPLVQNYTAAAVDDHDTSNVIPFVDSLAVYCNTNPAGQSGTNVFDLATGAQNWLNKVGLGTDYTIQVVPVDTFFGFEFIREQVLLSQDVILLIGFWQEVSGDFCERRGGHYMTVAGVCPDLADSALCFSDPYYDLNEGNPPGVPPHAADVHNDAQFVSGPHGTMHHDKYYVIPSLCQPTSGDPWHLELANYAINPGIAANFDGQNSYDPAMDPAPPNNNPVHALLEFAVVICPDTTPEPTDGKVKHNLDGYIPEDGNPIGTNWHELWPSYCRNWTCSSWTDNGDGILSYCDTIDFVTNTIPRVKSWEHVEVVTPTITLTDVNDPNDTTYLDLIQPPNPLIDPITNPIGTWWHEVFPNYCVLWEITQWADNGNGFLDSCDYIDIQNPAGDVFSKHVESVETDIITTPLVPPDADEFDHNTDGYLPWMNTLIGTSWHELWPTYCQNWKVSAWHDNGDSMLSYCDTIAFTSPPGGPDTTIWKHVLEVTGTMVAVNEINDTFYLDYMCGNPLADMINLPIGTFWHEVYPTFCRRWICRGWTDNGNFLLDSCDFIDLELIDGADSGLTMSLHMVGWHTDIISEYVPPPVEPPEPIPGKVKHNLDGYLPEDGSPINTRWHELWPLYCDTFLCTSWHDNGDGILSACDTLDFIIEAWNGWKTWQHVEAVVPTLKVTDPQAPGDTSYFDGLDPNPLIQPITNPVGTWWHEVYPNYCVVWQITAWVDNGNGILDFCDMITFSNAFGQMTRHVEDIQTDIITSPLPNPDADEYDHNLDGYRPSDGDPTGSLWHELWPNFCEMYHVDSWQDNGDGILSFCDTLRFRNLTTDSVLVKHVLEVTGTMKAFDGTDTVFYDYMCGNPMAAIISDPIGRFWHEIWPVFSLRWLCIGWTDNGNGFLDSCDWVELELLDGTDSGLVKTVHVEGWETDIITEIVGEPGVPEDTCEFYKAPYQDYSPFGVPDFDQKQDGWMGQPFGGWSYCGPVALADCFWWMDSRFEKSTSPPPPSVSDSYPLVQNYNPVGLFDDHMATNVLPFVDSLAAHSNCSPTTAGTWIRDLYNGAVSWLATYGLDTVDNHIDVNLVPGPDFEFIKKEVLRSEDVILLLGFYEDHGGPEGYCRLGGHYVTVAGVCTTDTRICLADPWYDENEGEPPSGSAHGSAVHNDAQYVSGPHGTIHHDAYLAVNSPIPAPNPVVLELADYHDNWTTSEVLNFAEMNQTDPALPYCQFVQGPIVTMIDYALTISPCCNQDGIRGDADNDCTFGCVNVADLSYLVAYLFQNGPAPFCFEEANADADCTFGCVNVADLSYLVAFLFGTPPGPAPPPCP